MQSLVESIKGTQILEEVTKIDVPAKIEVDGTEYELVVAKDYSVITGKTRKGILAQYIDKDYNVFAGFVGQTTEQVEKKIKDFLKTKNIK